MQEVYPWWLCPTAFYWTPDNFVLNFSYGLIEITWSAEKCPATQSIYIFTRRVYYILKKACRRRRVPIWINSKKHVYSCSHIIAGTMFPPCKVEIVGYQEETVSLRACQRTREVPEGSTTGVELPTDLDTVIEACVDMRQMLKIVIEYVDIWTEQTHCSNYR